MQSKQGSILIYVILLTTAISFILVAALHQSSTILTESQERYYFKVAEEAAEAGTAYASACLENNDRRQVWGDDYFGGGGANRPSLSPSTDCQGTANAYSSNQHVYSDSGLQSTFSVGKLGPGSLENSAIISSTGKVSLVSGGSVTRTIEVELKKTVTWDPNLIAEKSASATTRTCGLVSGNVFCWGTNQYGQLGNGTDGGGSTSVNASRTPVRLIREAYPGGIGNKRVTDIAAGGLFNCIIIDTGEVYCWGQNHKGQLGQGNNNASSVPLRVQGLLAGKTVVQLGVTSSSICALTDTGSMYCWGNDRFGQLGNNRSYTEFDTPQAIAGPGTPAFGGLSTPITGLSRSGAFNSHMCAISAGKAYCWGSGDKGQLGTGNKNDQRVPTAVVTWGALSGKTVIDIAGDGNPPNSHTCALAYASTVADTKVYCWGSNSLGQIGNGSTAYSTDWTTPTAVSTGPSSALKSTMRVTEIAVSDIGSCVVAYAGGNPDNSRAYCWGSKTTLGGGSSVPWTNPQPVAVAGILQNQKTTNIVGGAQRACANSSGKAYCWGVNGVGQIGDGTTTVRYEPTEALFLRPRSSQFIY